MPTVRKITEQEFLAPVSAAAVPIKVLRAFRGSWQGVLLQALYTSPSIAEACRIAGVTLPDAAAEQDRDALFAQMWSEVLAIRSVPPADETQNQLLDAIRQGQTIAAACRSVGIASTLVTWWLGNDAAFRAAWTAARAAGAAAIGRMAEGRAATAAVWYDLVLDAITDDSWWLVEPPADSDSRGIISALHAAARRRQIELRVRRAPLGIVIRRTALPTPAERKQMVTMAWQWDRRFTVDVGDWRGEVVWEDARWQAYIYADNTEIARSAIGWLEPRAAMRWAEAFLTPPIPGDLAPLQWALERFCTALGLWDSGCRWLMSGAWATLEPLSPDFGARLVLICDGPLGTALGGEPDTDVFRLSALIAARHGFDLAILSTQAVQFYDLLPQQRDAPPADQDSRRSSARDD